MIYGIDLGTTNSVVGRVENGQVVFLSELYPSVVDLSFGSSGKAIKQELATTGNQSIVSSFKVDILEDYSVTASSHVLRALKTLATGMTDVVISVPAYFSAQQRAKTIEAATRAGLHVKALINEPTAAAIYYNKDIKDVTLVYDLGGGTFDVSVVDSRFGRYDVQVTDGLKLGGVDLDNTLFQMVLSQLRIGPHSMSPEERRMMLEEIECAKIQIQQSVPAINVGGAQITPQLYEMAVRHTFEKTIAKTRSVIATSCYNQTDMKLVFVGGSTRDPFLRDMVTKALGMDSVEMTYNPDEIVAQGAAYFAWLLDTGKATSSVTDVSKAVSIRTYNNTAHTIVAANTMLPSLGNTHIVYNEIDSDGVSIELYQGNSAIPEDNDFLGVLDYDYGRVVPAQQGLVTLTLDLDRSGLLTVTAGEPGCEPVKLELRL